MRLFRQKKQQISRKREIRNESKEKNMDDFLLKQIDEFRDKAQQLQDLINTKETKVRELQLLVDERESKATKLQMELDDRSTAKRQYRGHQECIGWNVSGLWSDDKRADRSTAGDF